MTIPHVPVSWGELIDRITILEIKTVRLPAAAARANAARELALLRGIAAAALAESAVAGLALQLKGVNEALWEIEDRIRDKERNHAFDAEFIELARAVYKRNDERGKMKRAIDVALKSELTEEKSYSPY
ncbi:MAG TPA: DUF6165 family protein [Rhizomicrobium sp.]|nr:DUF6165 family protein [Rhizomicrobium sp.]